MSDYQFVEKMTEKQLYKYVHIVPFVRSFSDTVLVPRKKDYVGDCPFHPSRNKNIFACSQKDGVEFFNCPQCGRNGNAADFVMQLLQSRYNQKVTRKYALNIIRNYLMEIS